MGLLQEKSLPRLLVYYPHGFSIRGWRQAYERGERPEPSHWGMHQAGDFGFELISTEDKTPGPILEFIRKVGQRLFKVNIAHLVLNWQQIREADAIWAMSEREINVLVWATTFRSKPPLIFGEAVWLVDEWPTYGPFRRFIAQTTLKRAASLLVCVEQGANYLNQILSNVRARPYKFGVPVDAFEDVRELPGFASGWSIDRPLRVLSAGNDLRRDWETVVQAVAGDDQFETVLLSRRPHVKKLIPPDSNIRHEPAVPFKQLREWYGWTDVVIIASKPNHHGAGLTMFLEAAASGVPIISAQTGSLEEYLPEDCVTYVPCGDAEAMRQALCELRDDPEGTAQKAMRAYKRAQSYSSRSAVKERCDVIWESLDERRRHSKGP